ncbi:uncharacterized protein LOC133178575 [Saccostrea echinata]|uniref:uncharacterized protein LOC133178575 n=1 Tax=Saccostrea echinata TaxID=191078 RepID=UPI002A8199A1|nr:uncharacterized protein LOC133178575 [Saccostrea echinata]
MLIFLLLFFEGTDALNCVGRNREVECCTGYKWNDITGNCSTKCDPGYFGINCTGQCSPGRYGEACAYQCVECEKTECNVSFGCPVTITEKIQGIENRNHAKEENAVNIWQMVSLGFSVGTFAVLVIVLAYKYTYRNWIKVTANPQAENNTKADSNYLALNNIAVYSGMAKVQINLNTSEKNFTVILNTDSEGTTNIEALRRLENSEPKSPYALEASLNGNAKVYETLH